MLVASLMMLSMGKGFWWTGQPRSSPTTRSGKSLLSENVSLNISLFHRQRSHRGFEGTYQFEGKELPPMKALPIKATSTVEMMIKDLGDELERDQGIYWPISSILIFVEISMCNEGGVKDVHTYRCSCHISPLCPN